MYRKLQFILIPSHDTMLPFSALAFLSIYKFDEFIKLILFNLIIIAEPIEQRSNRSRKPKVHFDDQIAESIGLSKPSKPSKSLKGPVKPTESTIKSTTKLLNPSTRASTSAKPSISTKPSILDPIE